MNTSSISKANKSFNECDYEAAIKEYIYLIISDAELYVSVVLNLILARQRWRQAQAQTPRRIVICGWGMSHNAAGRVFTLAEIAQTFGTVQIIGATFPRWGHGLWTPAQGMGANTDLIHITNDATFTTAALELVLKHPCDTVILSKPRFPNIVIGLLYKLVWDARVIMDIDDEELGAVKAESSMPLEKLLAQHGGTAKWHDLGGKSWTRAAVTLWDIFDASTVSNSSLQSRYAGPIIPHARDAQQFCNSPERRAASRQKFGIPQDMKVVLFFGTPRRHKGLMQTAQAVAALGRTNVCFVIVGDIPDQKLKQELLAVKDADIRFYPDQPYTSIASVVALGDICVLHQDDTDLLGRYQLPAKLVDALAMQLLVLARSTPALMHIVEAGAVVPITTDNLQHTLAHCLDNWAQYADTRQRGRDYFENELSLQVAQARYTPLWQVSLQTTVQAKLFANAKQQALFDALGGWQMFEH